MRTIKYILGILFLLNISCCVNQKKKDEEQIKNTVKEYLKAVKENDLQKVYGLIDDSDTFFGGIQGEFYFLKKNYDKINPNNILLKNIKVKDTVVTFAQNKQKYVQYVIKKENDSNYLKKPLIITFMFYKPVGYNKIYNSVILQNHIGWDK
ncbi:hypothetical protein IQ37_19325 [Chryseobacterium piperi]|uniref:Uncharacterized protein n=1 Tax=Chryseobacterium piperi TaxID=558152 RepID=A0A086A7I7_9FLAO|nr:hypothetical protein [Chryseobacterium piperi]ASW73628.1 hypothetical protein CJF12_04530 [Chryseobacterium piperi]KFF12651.1 hypothetical protein IQ37_19325 [Chryseobacterium piperi]